MGVLEIKIFDDTFDDTFFKVFKAVSFAIMNSHTPSPRDNQNPEASNHGQNEGIGLVHLEKSYTAHKSETTKN